MSRKRKQKDDVGNGHNGPVEIVRTDDENRALFFHFKRRYESALSEKREAAAALMELCKEAKRELGKNVVDDIKTALALDAPGGELAMQREIERQQRIARWMGLPIGTQQEFDLTDRRPAEDRAFDKGKEAGMSGVNCSPPNDVASYIVDDWVRGWHEGQAALMSAFRKRDMPAPEAALDEFDSAAPQADAATFP